MLETRLTCFPGRCYVYNLVAPSLSQAAGSGFEVRAKDAGGFSHSDSFMANLCPAAGGRWHPLTRGAQRQDYDGTPLGHYTITSGGRTKHITTSGFRGFPATSWSLARLMA